jgi:hypothetical protein
MDIICVNGKFTPEQIAIIPSRPAEGTFYTIREIVKTRMGMALLLNEIKNPNNGTFESMGNEFTFEPSFGIWRFTTLDGRELTEEMLRSIKITA